MERHLIQMRMSLQFKVTREQLEFLTEFWESVHQDETNISPAGQEAIGNMIFDLLKNSLDGIEDCIKLNYKKKRII